MEKKEKIPFDTYELAFAELERILTTQQRPWSQRDYKPSRIYEKDGKFYLTSKPFLTEY